MEDTSGIHFRPYLLPFFLTFFPAATLLNAASISMSCADGNAPGLTPSAYMPSLPPRWGSDLYVACSIIGGPAELHVTTLEHKVGVQRLSGSLYIATPFLLHLAASYGGEA